MFGLSARTPLELESSLGLPSWTRVFSLMIFEFTSPLFTLTLSLHNVPQLTGS